jgi:AhpD family alkylhydroperoxidase
MVEPPRFQISNMPQDVYRHLRQIEVLLAQHVDLTLYHLIKLRASQINGCAYCLAMHTDEATKHGEKVERITALDAWHESPLFTDNERAALAWTEELTLISEKHASREAFDELKRHFSDEEIGWLIIAAVQINSWNRISISTRAQYDPAAFAAWREKTPEPA